jgi:hypothetical protein
VVEGAGQAGAERNSAGTDVLNCYEGWIGDDGEYN